MIRDLIKDKIQTEDAFASEKIPSAQIPVIKTVFEHDLQVSAGLPGQIGYTVADSRGYANAVWEHNIFFEESVHDSRTEDSPE
jgi:hypothetical protein